jgi:hypothetical protein
MNIMDDRELIWVLDRTRDSSSSGNTKDPKFLASIDKHKLSYVLSEFSDRTRTSDSLSDLVKIGRLILCVDTADAVRLPRVALSILRNLFPLDRHMGLRSVEMGKALKSHPNRT